LDSCWLLAWELVTPQVGIQQCALEKKLVFRSSEGNLERKRCSLFLEDMPGKLILFKKTVIQ
jgi:hypothetical protein